MDVHCGHASVHQTSWQVLARISTDLPIHLVCRCLEVPHQPCCSSCCIGSEPLDLCGPCQDDMGVAALRHSSIRPLQTYADGGISKKKWIDSNWRHQLGIDAGVIMACDFCIIAGQGLVTGICSSWHLEWTETSVQAHQVEIDVRAPSCTR